MASIFLSPRNKSLGNLRDVFFDYHPVRVVIALLMAGPTPFSYRLSGLLRFPHWVWNGLDLVASLACVTERINRALQAVFTQIVFTKNFFIVAHGASFSFHSIFDTNK